MARYTTIHEGSSGKIGKIVTYQMYGNSYMRAVPSHYTDRKSEKQLAQRQKMQLVNGFLSPFKDILKLTFKEAALGKSAYMAAKSYNMRNAITGIYPEQQIDYSQALVSNGSIPLPEVASAIKTKDGTLISWKCEEDHNSYDTLMLVACARGKAYCYHKTTGVERMEESYLWKETFGQDSLIDIWLIFRDEKEQGFSNSLWLGTI